MAGLSGKEIEVVSHLELEGKQFFKRADIRTFFKNRNEMNVYINRLKRKGRLIKLNGEKYYLIPVRAYKGRWSEHPFIVIDEVFNGKNYFIGGKAAANYWGHIDQIPTQIDVYSTKRQGEKKIFNFRIRYRRTTHRNMKNFVSRKIKNHQFLIAGRKRSEQWK